MAVNKFTTARVKVSISIETKAALELVAEELGVSLSRLLVQAAVELYLLKRSNLPVPVAAKLCDRLV